MLPAVQPGGAITLDADDVRFPRASEGPSSSPRYVCGFADAVWTTFMPTGWLVNYYHYSCDY